MRLLQKKVDAMRQCHRKSYNYIYIVVCSATWLFEYAGGINISDFFSLHKRIIQTIIQSEYLANTNVFN